MDHPTETMKCMVLKASLTYWLTFGMFPHTLPASPMKTSKATKAHPAMPRATPKTRIHELRLACVAEH